MTPTVLSQLAPRGVLRAGINMSNFLLVTGKSEQGEPVGVAPDMAREISRRLGVSLQLVPFAGPGELIDAAQSDMWDIGLVAIEPARATHVSFSPAYVEIEATYLVAHGSPFQRVDQVDSPGVKIAVADRTAFELWLTRNLKQATLVKAETMDESFQQFVDNKLDALAGLRSGLIKNAKALPGSRLLDGRFTAVQQAIGTLRGKLEAAAFLAEFVEEVKASGWVADQIARHNVQGLAVAP